MQIHPAFVIILSLLGAYFTGILGFVIALPFTMIVVEVFKYIRNSNRERALVSAMDAWDHRAIFFRVAS
jgi:predicted PurR-regulated permease PerM